MVGERGDKNPNWKGGDIEFTCLGCGEKSHYRRGGDVKKYCTQKCYLDEKARNSSRANCDMCGGVIQRPKSHLARYGKKLCSVACRTKSQEGVLNWMYKGGDEIRNCIMCGIKILSPRMGAKVKKTCSKQCFSKNMSLTRTKPRKIKNCEYCGKEMNLTQNSKRRFCSTNCSNSIHSERVMGVGNGRYVHGMANAPYPTGWNNACKKIVRERDGYKCQLCGASQDKKLHDVHHINYIKEDLSLSNLITLCRKCHGGCHGNLVSREKWKEKLSSLLKKAA